MRLILNQIAQLLTEALPAGTAARRAGTAARRQLLLMLDEFPTLGHFNFFESSLVPTAGYGIRAFLVAQSLHQVDRA